MMSSTFHPPFRPDPSLHLSRAKVLLEVTMIQSVVSVIPLNHLYYQFD